MAIDWQVRILLEGGIRIWNEWRKNNSGVGVDLYQADLGGADLSYANLTNANLQDAKIVNANLTQTNLRCSNLRHSNFSGSVLRRTDLTGADLTGSDLSNTSLIEVTLDKTILLRATLSKTNVESNDLTKINGIEDVYHLGPSIVDKETFRKSQGRISRVFLRGCGLSDLEIEYARLYSPGLDPEQVTDIIYNCYDIYVGKGIQYYSCFISYNSRDDEFAGKLHNDLQDNGVRCWFAPEDMKIGDQIRPRIDQEIRLRDKLLVILSENSVQSEWVGDEVEAALEEEGKSNRLVLFPIRLDDAVMNTREDWAAKIKRRRHIGDFSKWKDKASYQKALERLLRDLKATGGGVNGE